MLLFASGGIVLNDADTAYPLADFISVSVFIFLLFEDVQIFLCMLSSVVILIVCFLAWYEITGQQHRRNED